MAGAEKNGLDIVLERIGSVFSVAFEPLEIDGRSLQMLGVTNMEQYLDRLALAKNIKDPLRDLPLWAKIWPGSMVLGRFLRKFEPAGKSLLELGAGMGALSLIASAHGFANILATDNNAMALDFCQANILKNNLSPLISTRKLEIGKDSLPDDAKYEMIAASELLYLDDLHRPLLKFLGRHLAPDGKAFFCTDMARSKPRFAKLAKSHFHIQEGFIGIKDNTGDRRVFSILILEKP